MPFTPSHSLDLALCVSCKPAIYGKVAALPGNQLFTGRYAPPVGRLRLHQVDHSASARQLTPPPSLGLACSTSWVRGSSRPFGFPLWVSLSWVLGLLAGGFALAGFGWSSLELAVRCPAGPSWEGEGRNSARVAESVESKPRHVKGSGSVYVSTAARHRKSGRPDGRQAASAVSYRRTGMTPR